MNRELQKVLYQMQDGGCIIKIKGKSKPVRLKMNGSGMVTYRYRMKCGSKSFSLDNVHEENVTVLHQDNDWHVQPKQTTDEKTLSYWR